MAEVKCNEVAEKFRNQGNVHFRNGEFREALVLYNKSACYANGPALSLAFANRSAVYLEVKKFEKCLENIEFARVHGYRDEKLNERERKCRIFMEIRGTDVKLDEAKKFFELTYPPNEKIPFIVNCIELRSDEKFGNYLVTKTKLHPGDVIAVEEPFYKFVDAEACYSRCKKCLKSKDLSLIPCSTCVSSLYCSQKCMLEHATRVHHVQCNKKPQPPVLVVCTEMLLTAVSIAGGLNQLRELLESTKRKTVFDFDFNDPTDPDYLRNLVVVVNYMAMSEASRIVITDQMKKTFNFAPFSSLWETDDEREFLIDCFHNQLRIHNTNQLEMGVHMLEPSDDEPYWCVKTIGSGLCPFASLFNHSCDANVKRTCFDNKIAFVIAKPIEPGDQLFISYGYSSNRMTRDNRRNLLQRFSFQCECEACIRDFPQTRDLPRLDSNFDDPDFKTMNTSDAIREFKRNCEYIEKNIGKHPCYETTLCLIHNDHLLNQISKEFI